MSLPEMSYAALGRCGTKVSRLSLGGWTTYGDSVTDQQVVRDIILRAYDAGVNFFDIADMYGRGNTELAMGKVFQSLPRHELVISSKVYFPMSKDVNDRGLSRKHIMESVEKSLKRIGTEYLDLYFCHRYDKETPLEETVRAMDDLVHQGKVLYWGTSYWAGEQIQAAHDLCREYNYYRPQVEQPQYSLLFRMIEKETLPVTDKAGMGIVVWSPLASGILTGKYDNGIPANTRLADERLSWLKDQWYNDDIMNKIREFKSIADELGGTRAQLALAWAMANKSVSSVIMGATRKEQLEDNLGALKLELSTEVLARLDRLFPYQAPEAA